MFQTPPQSAGTTATLPAPADCGYLSQLLVKSAQGDQCAFTDLYDETCLVVYGMAIGLLGSPAAADELTKTVYVRVWTQCRSFQQDTVGALTWIMSLAQVCAGQQLVLDSVHGARAGV